METFIPGNADFPTGEVVLADPLAYLGGEYATYLDRKVPAGSYPLELAVLHSELAGLRIAAARLIVSDSPAVRYEIAMPRVRNRRNWDNRAYGRFSVWIQALHAVPT